MDPLSLSRIQFAVTSIFHFFLVPLTLGLGYFVAILETKYVRTGDETYKRLAKFWGKLFLINFAVGVPTGVVMEFQIGMNWAPYSRFVGDVFGVPLAIEALLAFFLESTFLGIWIFGWERLSKGLHAATIWLVSIGTSMSALWILIANAFMQHPVGYVIADGRAVMVDFGAVVFNPRAWLFFWHTISAGFATAAFFMLGISAYHLARRQNVELFRKSFQFAAIVGILAAVMVGLTGDFQGRYLREVQPMAAAASEALWDTADPAPFTLVAIFDAEGREEVWSVRISSALSLLYYLKPAGEVEGINDLQRDYEAIHGLGNYIPPVALDFWMFRVMVGLGMLMIALGAYALYLPVRKWPAKWMRPLKWMVWVIALPYLANTAGWILTETARQPWIVTGLLLTRDAVSPNLSTGMVLTSLTGFSLLYLVLLVVDVHLLTRNAKAGPAAAGTHE
jgi:cytochrome bd ubiquinol oxidase subunit I